MYTLFDTFNQKPLSKHRTILAAVRRARRLNRAVQARHGSASYIPWTVLDHDGGDINRSPMLWDSLHPEWECLSDAIDQVAREA
jgi:hypothetical protein